MIDYTFRRRYCTTVCFSLLACTLGMHSVQADEGGVSFWLPGQFGSFSAVPVESGWSLATVYYHADTDADARREFSIGGDVVLGLNVDATLTRNILIKKSQENENIEAWREDFCLRLSFRFRNV